MGRLGRPEEIAAMAVIHPGAVVVSRKPVVPPVLLHSINDGRVGSSETRISFSRRADPIHDVKPRD